MKRSARIAATLAAGAALTLGGVAVAGPAMASGNGGQPAAAQPGAAPGSGHHGGGQDGRAGMEGTGGPGRPGGMGMGGHGGAGAGSTDREGSGGCRSTGVTAPSGTLTQEQKTALAGMAEEEKLAHDLYTAFADRYDLPVFDRIAAAETRHLDAVRTLLDRYHIADPTAGKAAGSFADPAVQATYDKLLSQGTGSREAALEAGRTVETDDIAGLEKARSGLTAPDVTQVYDTLLNASRKHLTAFERSLR